MSLEWDMAWAALSEHKKFVFFLGTAHDTNCINIGVVCSKNYRDFPETFLELVNWLKVNVKHRFTVASSRDFLFSDVNEAAYFKLVWG